MQIVGYRTDAGAGSAALLVGHDGTVREYDLDPTETLSFALDDRHCAGNRDDGTHVPCSRESAPYCDEHESRWPCARCTGTCAMPIEACHEQHAVYLAAFAPATVKVGVTRSWRLETRLREQGADRAAHVRTVKNGRIARQLEADWAKRFPDRVRIPTKVDSLHTTVDDDVWSSVLDEFDPIETFEFEYGFALDTRPVSETLASGTVVGTKGRVLVLERGGTTYAVDMRDLVGHDVTEERAARRLQSSFRAFE